jgi:hypothetical protein
MVEGLHTHIQNRTIKPFDIVLSGMGRGLQERVGDGGGNLTNVQCKAIEN